MCQLYIMNKQQQLITIRFCWMTKFSNSNFLNLKLIEGFLAETGSVYKILHFRFLHQPVAKGNFLDVITHHSFLKNSNSHGNIWCYGWLCSFS